MLCGTPPMYQKFVASSLELVASRSRSQPDYELLTTN